MFSLREHDHRDAAFQMPPPQTRGYTPCPAPFYLLRVSDDSVALPPSGRVALPESDPELTAMLSRADESVGLHWRPPPSPERSRLDDWFLGAQADRRQQPPVPFFPKVEEGD